MKYHTYANLFPMMSRMEYEGLRDDIKTNGQMVPIIIHENQILDGRNRFKACHELDVPPVMELFSEYSYTGSDPLSFVISNNLHRRHLSSSQRACLALDCVAVFQEEARNAQIEGGRNKVRQSIAEAPDERKSSQRASKLFGTNRTYVQLAKKLQDQDPSLLDDVRSGEITIFQAWKSFNTSNIIEAPAIEGKFGIIYCDPPWRYNNPFCSPSLSAKHRYPTMSLTEILDMKDMINKISMDQSMVFMWVTNAFLAQGLKVLEVWGFKYSTSILWDKGGNGNDGVFTRVKHEILLIGSKNGGLQVEFKPSSVQRFPKTNHSQKPIEFYQLIETMFPNSTRIELFSREKQPNWSSWGNQSQVKNASKTLNYD